MAAPASSDEVIWRSDDKYQQLMAYVPSISGTSRPKIKIGVLDGAMTSSDRSVAVAFADALRRLRREAGQPTLKAIAKSAAGRTPPVTLSDSTMSGWFKGGSVPSDPPALWAVVEYLLLRCPGGVKPGARTAWEKHRHAAAAESDRRRGRRTRSAVTVKATPSASVRQPLTVVPVAEADPQDLGVHAAIRMAGGPDGMPAYVGRDVDAEVQACLRPGRFVLLVGGSSVGKTRTLYEAVRAALPASAVVRPRSAADFEQLTAGPGEGVVVWLDDLHDVLGADSVVTAATVRRLQDLGFIVAGTMWTTEYTMRTDVVAADQQDLYAAAREVLRRATVIMVNGHLTAAERERAELLAGADERIVQSLQAVDVGFTQTLAAAQDLVLRWRQRADPYGAALISVAVHARVVGIRALIPVDVLRAAATGYLTGDEQADAPDSWFPDAVKFATSKVKRAARALVPDGQGKVRFTAGYRAADFLVQYAQQEADEPVPASAWQAWAEHGLPYDRVQLRRYVDRHPEARRHAGLLYRTASDRGDPVGRAEFALLLVSDGDVDSAVEVLRSGPSAFLPYDRPYAAEHLLSAGAADTAIDLLQAEVDADASQPDPFVIVMLAEALANRGRLSDGIRVLQDALHRAGLGGTATDGTAAAILGRFFGQADARWLRPLHAAGFFALPPAPVPTPDGLAMPNWPASFYLARVAADDPEGAIAAALGVPATDNITVIWDLVRIGLAVPADLAAPLAVQVNAMISSQFGVAVPSDAGKLAAHLAEGGHAALALQLMRSLLQPLPRQTLGRYEHVQILRESMPTVVAASGLPALRLLLDLLEQDAADGHASGAQYRSGLWRTAMEHNFRTTTNDPRNALIDAVLVAVDEMLRAGTATLADVIGELTPRPYTRFRRLALHLLAVHGATDPTIVGRYLTDAQVLSHDRSQREVVQLIAAGAGWLTPRQRQTMLRRIEHGPDPSTWRYMHQRLAEGHIDEAALTAAQQRWQRDLLDAVASRLTGRRRDLYQTLIDTHGAASDWTAHDSISYGWEATERNDRTLDASTLDPTQLAQMLLELPPLDGQDDEDEKPTPQGVTAAVTGRPAQHAAEATVFIGLGPAAITAVMDGFAQAAAAIPEHAWESLLTLCSWVQQQAEAEMAQGVESLAGRRWRAPLLHVLRLLGVGAQRQRIPDEAAHRERIWRLVAGGCGDPDPAADSDEEPWHGEFYLAYAERSIRAAALRAVVAEGLRALHDERHEDVTAALALLGEHVDPAADGALSVRAVFGELLHVIAKLDPRWTVEHLDQMLPLDPAKADLWVVVWDAYLHVTVRDAAWPLLRQHYRRAVELLDPQATAKVDILRAELLADHLGNRYWWGLLSLDDDDRLLQQFYDRCPAAASATILGSVGASLARLAPDEARRERLMRLWQYRIDAARNDGDSAELTHFDTWFTSGLFPDRWALQQLRTVVELVESFTLDPPVLARLAALADQEPHACLDVLDRWLQKPLERTHFHRSDDLEVIIAVAGGTDDAAAATARRIVGNLGLRQVNLRAALNRPSTRHAPPAR
ncbi:hypothetical protein AB0H83_45775 [Dactylosporangium sp. NPDC050688]|uniref:hypothetical protein n=1 Tax=Dactylosporangium sp. NPDC050688 TaxID=3157217 RepID=UPI0033E2FD13